MHIDVEYQEETISDDEAAALVVQALFGKSLEEVAKEFLVSEETMKDALVY